MGMEKVLGKKMKRKLRHKKVTAVQKLYDTCREVFSTCGPGIVPTADGIERLKVILNEMTELDVGVRPSMPYFKVKESGGFPKITYLHLSECDKFSIGIFLLPPSGVLPLHNHPQMTVFSKLLFGTMHIKAYDWVDDVASIPTLKADSSEGEIVPVSVRLAKLKVNSDFTAPCDTSILYPTDGGNMHCFTAITACAVLDVLGPPYCDPEGRHCQYYRAHPFTSLSVDKKLPDDEKTENYAWLEEIDKPAGLSVVGALYNGPKIIEK
uniref:plant cysteine oxidase 2 n=1 Tax=Erigeron canadensis TaxID=72917 RepID=UPI001CB9520E|nr:plant cysteine oxidase 2 [Erigeron canadensis]